MSLILEALRKSEAERRRGLPPDLHAERPQAPATRRRALPAWWWGLFIVVLAALGAWLWQLPDRSATPAPASTATTTAPASPAPAAPIARATPAPADALPARTPAPAVAPAPAPPSPQEEAEPASPPAPATTRSATLPPPASAPTPAADPGHVLTLGELDSDTRKALPPLRMSMHLWNEVPEQRFVIIDGKRLGEGDLIGDATLVRIERDGVLLEWKGRGLRLPAH